MQGTAADAQANLQAYPVATSMLSHGSSTSSLCQSVGLRQRLKNWDSEIAYQHNGANRGAMTHLL